MLEVINKKFYFLRGQCKMRMEYIKLSENNLYKKIFLNLRGAMQLKESIFTNLKDTNMMQT